MPKRTDIKSILILGAGPIVIGQACEFDYSGAQACKALREEGYRVILVNSNPATIMTDPEMADATYIEPIHWEVVRKIIEKERPDAVLPTMGGQTALNCALELVLQQRAKARHEVFQHRNLFLAVRHDTQRHVRLTPALRRIVFNVVDPDIQLLRRRLHDAEVFSLCGGRHRQKSQTR